MGINVIFFKKFPQPWLPIFFEWHPKSIGYQGNWEKNEWHKTFKKKLKSYSFYF